MFNFKRKSNKKISVQELVLSVALAVAFVSVSNINENDLDEQKSVNKVSQETEYAKRVKEKREAREQQQLSLNKKNVFSLEYVKEKNAQPDLNFKEETKSEIKNSTSINNKPKLTYKKQ